MRIGTVEINSQLALAPMAGVTDAAFRELCASLGAGLTCTELVSSKALCYQDKKSRTLLAPFPGEHPMQAQIFGSDPVCMAEAAQIAIEASGAGILDINMGCPVGKVVNNGDGSALMRDPEKGGAHRRGGGQGGKGSGHGEDAPRLGQGQHQRAGAGRAARERRRGGHHRPRAHPRADVRRAGRLVDHPRGQGSGEDPRYRQRRCFTPENAIKALKLTGADAVMIGAAASAIRGSSSNAEPRSRASRSRRCRRLPSAATRWCVRSNAARNSAMKRSRCSRRGGTTAGISRGVKYANYYKDQINHMETLEDLYRVTAGIKRDLSD